MEGKDIPFGVGVLVIKDGRILCGKRSDNGMICGPGGHIEDGETPESAALREATEEFGIRPTKLTKVGALSNSRGLYRPSMVFLCTDYTGDVKSQDGEMTAAYWATPEELDASDKLFPVFADSLELLNLKIASRIDGKSEMSSRGRYDAGKVGAPYGNRNAAKDYISKEKVENALKKLDEIEAISDQDAKDFFMPKDSLQAQFPTVYGNPSVSNVDFHKLTNLVKENAPRIKEKVPIKNIITEQVGVSKAKVQEYIDAYHKGTVDSVSGNKPVLGIKGKNNIVIIEDGNHRATAAKLLGIDKIEMELYDTT